MLAGLTAASALATTVRVGLYENRPKVFTDDHGQPAGIFVDLIRAVAQSEGWTLVYIPCTWKQGLDRLRAGELDLMPDVAYSTEREALYAFTREVVLSDWFQVWARTDSRIHSIVDLNGRRVAVLEYSVQHDALIQLLKGFDFQCDILTMPDYHEAFELIERGQAEAVIVNRFYRPPNGPPPHIKETPIIFHPTRLHFAAPPGSDPTVRDAVDRHLAAWKNDDESVYYATLRRWTSEEPERFIPAYIPRLLILAGGLLLLAIAISAALKWQVHLRTRDLEKKNRELEAALTDLKRAQDQAMKQERLHALGQMAGGIAHDFNNVLLPITGYTELLLAQAKGPAQPEETQRMLGIIAQAGHDAAELVKRMREFYRTHEGETAVEPLRVADLFEGVIALAKPRYEQQAQARGAHINVRASAPPDLLIQGDRTELREALLNLVLNAVDALPGGGVITLAAHEMGDQITLSVDDNGEGMSEDVLRQCVLPFFTTKGEAGTGMGLSMVKDIADRHGGRVDIQSRPGQGTCVRLILPALNRYRPPPPNAMAAAPRRRLKILAVDDNPRALQVLKELLEIDGHEVSTVCDPREALEKTTASAFDVIITDLAMPYLSGDQLAAALRARGCRAPLFIVTGTTEYPMDRFDRRNVAGVLRKPVSLHKLRTTLSSLDGA